MIQADRKTISSWTKDAFELNKDASKQIKGRLQADHRRLQADKKDNFKQMSKPRRAETEVICNQEL